MSKNLLYQERFSLVGVPLPGDVVHSGPPLMLPEAYEVGMARWEAHEPLLVLDHRIEEVADGEVPAVRRLGRRSSERRPGVRSAAARQAAHTGLADP